MVQKLKKHESPYEPISRETIQAIKDPVALAIWVYLMSKPSDWNIVPKELEEHFGIGRDKRLKAIKTLESLGLYVTTLIRDDKGQLKGRRVDIYHDIDTNRNTEKPKVGKSESRFHRKSENPTPYIIQIYYRIQNIYITPL